MKVNKLKGKVAIISGAGGNLGPIWCETLEKEGVTVFDFDKNVDFAGMNIDITNDSQLDWLYCAVKEWGETKDVFIPNIIINNAAIDHPPQVGIDFWTDTDKILDVNLLGAVKLTKLFINDMIKNGGGVIINIGSIQGNVAADWRNYEEDFTKPCGYNLSKAALIQFTRSIAVQYGPKNIRSVCLAFGAVDTGKFKDPFRSKFLKCLPLNRFVSIESCKRALLFACKCPELTGQQILIDSGYTAW